MLARMGPNQGDPKTGKQFAQFFEKKPKQLASKITLKYNPWF
jgi:hypothetical protein